jgi:hypothetical protein
VAKQGFYGCVFCVNARFTDQGSRVNPTVSFINESGGFYHFWKEVSAGCAWNAWEVLLSGYVGWEVHEEGGANDGKGWRRIDELIEEMTAEKVKEDGGLWRKPWMEKRSCVWACRGRTM